MACIREQLAAQKDAIIAIDHLARERIVAGSLIRSAVKRDSEELDQRKLSYDGAYSAWNRELFTNLIFVEDLDQGLAKQIDDGDSKDMTDVQGRFFKLDTCYTHLYDWKHGNVGAYDAGKCFGATAGNSCKNSYKKIKDEEEDLTDKILGFTRDAIAAAEARARNREERVRKHAKEQWDAVSWFRPGQSDLEISVCGEVPVRSDSSTPSEP